MAVIFNNSGLFILHKLSSETPGTKIVIRDWKLAAERAAMLLDRIYRSH